MSDFKDKKVLITGGASGIGLLMGKMAFQNGAGELIIWDINQQLMTNEINNLVADGHNASGHKVDVSDAKSVNEAATTLIDEGKVPDIVILNAGIVSGKYFHEHLDGEIEKTIGVNVLGCMLVARAFLPEMIRRGSGHIVTIASAAGMLSNPKMAVYAASKWAALGWSESLRLEMALLKTGIRVTTVTPSYIDTGMFDGVRTNFLFPTQKPEKAASKIIRGIRKNKVFVRMPFMVYSVPFFKGILPTKWFDLIVGKGLGVYESMNSFKGRT
jgi:all-trans-retinol dehydrogenase (NAD+)